MPRRKEFDESTVLEKAINVFWENGYNATSFEELVKHMGINRASIYATFGDKRTLFLKALKQYQVENFTHLKQNLLQSGTARERLERFFNMGIEQTLQDKQHKGCFVINSTTEMAACDQEIAQFVQKNKKDLLALIAFIIQDGQANGEVDENKDSIAMANFIYNSYSGLQVTHKVNPEEKALLQIKDLTLSVLD